jgi:hypothetical protein
MPIVPAAIIVAAPVVAAGLGGSRKCDGADADANHDEFADDVHVISSISNVNSQA